MDPNYHRSCNRPCAAVSRAEQSHSRLSGAVGSSRRELRSSGCEVILGGRDDGFLDGAWWGCRAGRGVGAWAACLTRGVGEEGALFRVAVGMPSVHAKIVV